MPKSRLAAVATAAAITSLATTGVAAAATPPVSKEVVATRRTAPLTIPGTGVKKGARLPRGARLVFRTVTLGRGRHVTLTLRAPAHTALRGLAPSSSRAIAFTVVRPKHFVGRKAVVLRAVASPAAGRGVHRARIWALVR